MPVSRDKMGETYGDLVTDWERISRVAYAEEEAFRKTLASGTTIFDTAARQVRDAGGTELAGERAFALHDTYGFPIDLTLEMASEAGLTVDEAGFRGLMSEQRERAKADARAKRGQHADTGVYRDVLDAHGPTEWLAYETLETESRPLALLSGGAAVEVLGNGEVGELVLDRTPFYAESGGQAADAGIIEFDGGRLEVRRRPAAGARPRRAPGARGRRRAPRGRVRRRAAARAGRPRLAHRRAPGALRHPRGARGAAPGARPQRAAVRLLQPTRLPAARLRLDPVARPRPAARDRAGLQRGAARRPARRLAVHDAGAGQGVGRGRAVRRDLRLQPGARRRDRRALVARALRRHPRRPRLADRHRGRHRRVVGRLRQPTHRGVHRGGGLRLPRPGARRRRPAHRPAQDPARRPRRPGRRPRRPAPRGGEGDREGARAAAARGRRRARGAAPRT